MSDTALSRLAAAPSNGAYNATDQEIYRLKADIALRRQRVVASVGELRRRVDGIVDWRHWVRANPLKSIGAALSLGFILGGGLRRRRETRLTDI